MEEEKQGLDILTKQKEQRQSYTRTISVEFLKPAKPARKKKKEKRKLNSQNTTEIDSLEYEKCSDDVVDSNFELELPTIFSNTLSDLGEDFVTDRSGSTGDSESESYFTAEEQTDSDDSENEDFEDQFSSACSVSLQTDINHVVNKNNPCSSCEKRKPNKRQKRKRRVGTFFLEDMYPLQNDSIFNLEFDDIMDTVSQKTLTVDKNVPSLVELCLRCSQGIFSATDTATHYIRRTHQAIFRDMFLYKCQLACVSYVLARCEPDKDNNVYLDDICNKDYSHKKYLFPVSCRNVWNQAMYIKNYPYSNDNVTYTHRPLTACLSYTSIIIYLSMIFVGYNKDIYLQSLFQLSVFVSAIDLMMPSRYKSSSSAFLRKRMKLSMQKRFPGGSKVCFDRALPYVYWTRGEVKQATENFLDLVQKETKGRIKALYLNETARMYAHIGDSELASRFYMLASDAALEKPRDPETIRQICGQTQFLLANLNDQGLLTDEKARKSKSHWTSIITSPEIFNLGSARAGIEALLCYHGYSWTDNENSWLSVAVDWLTKLVKHNHDLHYHLAMVYALMGNLKESRIFASLVLPMPAHFKPLQKPYLRQWRCVAKQPGPVPHVRVLWRTQLCPPLYNTQDQHVYPNTEADFCSPELHLRLSTDGYLTGDMQMVLPPIRGIYLNPYTGSISFSGRKTEDWKYHHLDEQTKYNYFYGLDNLFIIPIPYELYSDEDGIKVQLLQPHPSGVINFKSDEDLTPKPMSSVILMWSNNCQTAKFNLKHKIAEFLFKKTKAEIEKKHNIELQHYSPETKELLLYLTELARNHQSCISLKHFEKCVKDYKRRKRNFKRFKKQSVRIKDNFKTYSGWYKDVAIKLRGQTVWYGKTLMFTVTYNNESTIRVIIDCSSRESFLNPVFYIEHGNLYTVYENLKGSNIKTPGAEVAWFINTADLDVCILNQAGDMIDFFSLNNIYGINAALSTKICFTAHVMGDRLVYINPDKRLYVRAAEEDTCIDSFTTVSQVIVIDADLCFIQEDTFLHVFNISTENCLSFKVTNSLHRDLFDLEKDSIIVPLDVEVSVLGAKDIQSTDQITVHRLVLAINTLLLILEIPSQAKHEDCVTITTAVLLPGYPTDFCFVSETAGFLVTWTHTRLKDQVYHREHLFHLSSQGELLAVLPFLGRSPFSLFPVYLSGDGDIQEQYPGRGTRGWHVYMRDGHGGILGLKITDF